MNSIREIQCTKCRNTEKIHMDVQENLGPGKFSLTNTFFCNDCNRLSTIDTVKQKRQCAHCRGTSVSKMFIDSKVKCGKCGTNGFDIMQNVFEE